MRAARDVFSELGYDAATFQEIAIRAGLTRPAINHYFASKPALYREVEQSNALVLTAGIARAQGETTLPGRISAFIAPAIHGDSEDRSAAAFLVTSALESRRHPGLSRDGHDSVKDARAFLTWAVHDAVERGELSADTDVASLVEILVAMLWGMAFYAAFVGSRRQLEVVTDQLKLLLAGKLWHLSGRTVATVEKAKTTRRPVKLSELRPRADAPPL